MLKAPITRSIESLLEEWICDPKAVINELATHKFERQLVDRLKHDNSNSDGIKDCLCGDTSLLRLFVHFEVYSIIDVIDQRLTCSSVDCDDGLKLDDYEVDGWRFGYCARLDLELLYDSIELLVDENRSVVQAQQHQQLAVEVCIN